MFRTLSTQAAGNLTLSE